VGVFQFHQRSDFAGVELLHFVAVFAVENEHLSKSLGFTGAGVENFLPGLKCAGEHLDEGEFAEVLLVDGLEHERDRVFVVKRDGDLVFI